MIAACQQEILVVRSASPYRPGGLMNSAIDAAVQFLIRCIDDGTDRLFGDVTFND